MKPQLQIVTTFFHEFYNKTGKCNRQGSSVPIGEEIVRFVALDAAPWYGRR